MSKITDLATELGQAIEGDETFLKYQAAKAKHDDDSQLQELIGQFNLKKMSVMNMMNSSDKDDARLSQLQNEMHAAYEAVMRHPVMVEFNAAQQEMEKLVGEVYSILNYYITGEEPGGCTGSCSTCGGCH